MSIALIVVMISLFAYVQTHQIVHMKYIQFALYQLYFNKAILKRAEDKHFPKQLILR